MCKIKNMNLKNIELNKKYTWKEICELADIPYKTGNSKVKQTKQFESLCRFTKEKTKFIIHEIYDEPKEIEDGRKNNKGSDTRIRSSKYEPLDDQVLAMFDDIIENNPNLPIVYTEEDRENELYKVYLWTNEMKKVTGMVNSGFKGSRNDGLTRLCIKKSIENITPYDKYREDIIKKRNIKNEDNLKEESLMKEYEEYVNECANLIFNDILPTCKQRTD